MAIEKSGVTLVIPTLNEIKGMEWFMPQLKKEWYDELIIIDGGSNDGTIEYCRRNNYPIFIQSGKGLPNAYDDAFKMCTQEIIVTVTPDGNSISQAIPLLVDKIREGFDMVIASRYLKGAKSADDDIVTKFGNHMFTLMINLLFRTHYTDALVGFRAYRRDVIEKTRLYRQDRQGWLKNRFSEMNSWETGLAMRTAKLGLKVGEIPADEPKRLGGKRKLSIVRNGSGILFQIIHEFIIGCNFTK